MEATHQDSRDSERRIQIVRSKAGSPDGTADNHSAAVMRAAGKILLEAVDSLTTWEHLYGWTVNQEDSRLADRLLAVDLLSSTGSSAPVNSRPFMLRTSDL